MSDAKRIKLMQSFVASSKANHINRSNIFKPLVWIDCEMTGLNVERDHIIEICCIITDGHLNVIDEKGYESTVYYPESVLSKMNEWCINTHTGSGLYKKVLDNPQLTLPKVELQLLEYIKQYVEPNKAILSGNSIHMDKFFMCKEFPKVIDYLHYRLVDVSSIMEVGNRHNPELMALAPRKVQTHTAKSDIMESIAQLKWYREKYLKSEEETREFVQGEREKEKENEEKENEDKENEEKENEENKDKEQKHHKDNL